MAGRDEELKRVIAAAQALGLDSPIKMYRIRGERIELWTLHAGPFIYEPYEPAKPEAKTKRGKPRKFKAGNGE